MLQRLMRLMPTREQLAGNRWLRWLGPALFHPRLWHMSRRGVAAGAAIGVFFAFVTPIAQIPLSVALAVVARANVPVAVVATLVNTPITFGPVYYAAWLVGSAVLGEQTEGAAPPEIPFADTAPAVDATASGTPQPGTATTDRLARWWRQLTGVGVPLVLGAAIFAVVFGGLAWALVNTIWRARVRIKRRRRLRGRSLPKESIGP
jgi:uncharacterized protein (DUF2062 family)